MVAALLPDRPKRIRNMVGRCCVRFGGGKPLPEIKGTRLGFPQRQEFLLKMVSRSDFQFSYIVADKCHIQPDLLDRQNILFNYLTSILLRPFIRNAREDVQVVMDNRSRKVSHGNMLEQYLRMEAAVKWGFCHCLDVSYGDSRSVRNIQAADVISNTVFQFHERSNRHCYRLIRPFLRHGHLFPFGRFGS